jgi:hypothetical protein
MLQEVIIPSDGGFYSLPSSYVFLTDIDGFGNPEPKLGQHEYGNQHGGMFASQYYKSRSLALFGEISAPDQATFEQERFDLSQAFSFLNAEKLLKFTTFGGRALQCNVMIASRIRDKILGPAASSFAIELTAADPIFYSQDLHTVLGTVATLTGTGFALPFSFPLALSGSLEGIATVTNLGNARVYPTQMKLIGPGTDFTLSNKTTGKDLFYTGSLSAGEYVIIDPKRHTAYKNGTDNVYGNISGTWWDLYYGSNSAALVVGSGNTNETGFEISWRDGYWAI